jgi:hypothetical protein
LSPPSWQQKKRRNNQDKGNHHKRGQPEDCHHLWCCPLSCLPPPFLPPTVLLADALPVAVASTAQGRGSVCADAEGDGGASTAQGRGSSCRSTSSVVLSMGDLLVGCVVEDLGFKAR